MCADAKEIDCKSRQSKKRWPAIGLDADYGGVPEANREARMKICRPLLPLPD